MIQRYLAQISGSPLDRINPHINDKTTGAMVNQQPFGGGRGSGTNDKVGFYLSLLRWTSPRTLKENFVPPRHHAYPFMGEE
jgi:1-pyrroline-5-carboxylate dehydrogenase